MLVVVAALSPVAVGSQPLTPLEVGDRVRVTLASNPSEALAGQLTRVRWESITVWLDVPYHLRRNLEVPRAEIFRLERATRVEVDKPSVAKGILSPFLVVGITAASALIGGGLGAGVEQIFAGDPCEGSEWICIPTGAAVGFVAGAIAGLGISIWMLNQPNTEERWLPARLPGDAVGRAGGLPGAAPWGVALTVRF